MKYNLIETKDVLKSILELNNISLDELNKEYDFNCTDKVFINFKDELLKNKDLKFLIVGDFDADGIFATTIIKKLFIQINIESHYYIPSRINEGYGLNKDIVKKAYDNSINALILVDNGIKCIEEINYANSLGMKVFIIDHHEYDTLPNATIIHSNTVSLKYKDLSAAGLCYVLSTLFFNDDYLSLLAGLATISDVMPVIDFNRTLIKKMMNVLKTNKYIHFNLLNDHNEFDYHNISFNIIPKINALSRMEPLGNPNLLVKYLLSDNPNDLEFIESVNYINEKRKNESKIMYNKARLLLDDFDISVVVSDEFAEGLCGLVSGRLADAYLKPVIVLSDKGDYVKGSGRSYGNFNLYDALKPFDGFDAFGGHEMAVGLTIKKENLNSFIDFVKSLKVIHNEIVKDALLVDESILNNDFIDLIDSLKPFGPLFSEPLFVIKNNNYNKQIVSNRFAKYQIRNDLSAICFKEELKDIKAKYFIGSLKKDKYYKGSFQFLIEDLL